jgi:hypothetical protein
VHVVLIRMACMSHLLPTSRHVLGYVHDSVYVLGESDQVLSGEFQSIAQDIHSSTGFILALKSVSGSVIERYSPSNTGPCHDQSIKEDVAVDATQLEPTLPDSPVRTPVAKVARLTDACNLWGHMHGTFDIRSRPMCVDTFPQIPNSSLMPTSVSPVALASILQYSNNCIPWACIVLRPELERNVEFRSLASSPGPHRYIDVLELIEDEVIMEVVPGNAVFMDGDYLIHHDSHETHGLAHCTGMRVVDKQPYAITPSPQALPMIAPMPDNSIRDRQLIRLLSSGSSSNSTGRHALLSELAGTAAKIVIAARKAGLYPRGSIRHVQSMQPMSVEKFKAAISESWFSSSGAFLEHVGESLLSSLEFVLQ